MASKKKSSMSADAMASARSAALGKLGKYLSGRGAGSADAQVGRSAMRTRKFMIDVAAARGGGQGKVAPKKAVGSTRDKKMSAEARAKSFAKNAPVGRKPASAAKKPFTSSKFPSAKKIVGGGAKKPTNPKKK